MSPPPPMLLSGSSRGSANMAMPLCLRALKRFGATRLLRAPPVYRLHTAPRAESTVPITVSHSAPPKHGHHDDDDDDDVYDMKVYDKYPDWHGFSDNPEQDVRSMRLTFFLGVSVCLVLLPLFVHYAPGKRTREWSRREAERQIKRKEALGLPLIEINYYDPKRLVLPPDDE